MNLLLSPSLSPSKLLNRLFRSRRLPVHPGGRRPGVQERLQSAVIESLETRTLLSALHLVFSTEPTGAVAGNSLSSISVQIEDGSNNVDTSNNSLITFSINTGPTGSAGTLFFAVPAVNGVATLDGLAFTQAGAYTLAANATSITAAVSTSFTVSPDVASQLVITQGPSGTTAGQSLTGIQVSVEDQYGNVVTTDSSNVSMAVHSGSGTLLGTTTANASSGIATFSGLSITKADAYTLRASDGSLATATTGSFTIAPASASKLVIVNGPSTTTAGQAISSVTVAVEDQYNNVVTTDSSNISIAKASGSGTLLGTATANAAGGVATFSGLSIRTAGGFTLSVAENGLTGATSGSFTINPDAAAEVVFTTQPGGATAGALGSVVASVEDQYGNVVTGDTSSVALTINSVSATLGGTTTVAAISGVATFSNLAVTKSGTFTLAAADAALTGATSSSFIITPAAASKVAITQDAANATAGSTLGTFVVAVEDQYGNVLTGNSSNVTVALTGAGTLNGTKTVPASNGVATFSDLSLNASGSYAMNVTDGGLSAATSSTFQVVPAAASKLVYATGPSSTTAGALGTLVVSVEDQFNNVVTGDSSTVTLSVGSGSGALFGTLAVKAVNGVATFSDLAIDTVDSYTLHAADGVLTPITSSSFAVSPAAASKLAFTSQPDSIVAGNLLTGINVSVEDQFGNVVTSSSAHITFTVTGGGNTFHFVITASSGVAALTSIYLVKAGSYTVQASSSGVTAANSNAITVNPAAAYQLVITQDTAGTAAGQTLSPLSASVEDQFGNIVTSNTSNVAIAIASGPGTLQGTATTNAVAGVATFSNLSINTNGTYTFQVTENGLVLATSASFGIVPALATKAVITTQPVDTVAGQNLANVVVSLEDSFGNVVSIDTSNVTIAIASGNGTLLGTATANAVSGVATFGTLKIDQTGTFTLSAVDGQLTSATSSSFQITPAGADHLAFLTGPSSSAAGALNTITVAVEDQFNNVVTTDSTNVTLSVNTGSGTLLGTATANASAGVATFSATAIQIPDTYTLKGHDGGLTNAISGSFTISPAAPSQLVITQDTTATTAGLTLSAIHVSVEDQFGNVVTTDSSNVAVAIASGTGTLLGTATANAVNGVATFSTLKIDQAATFTLQTTETGLTSATTAPFLISPDLATKVVVTQQPTDTTAGQSISATKVSVEDQFGNVVTTNSSNITLAIGTGTGTLNGTATANAASGVATFSGLSIDQSGTFTLAASDSGLTGGSSNSFQINPNVATQLVITTQPALTGTVGTLSTIQVKVEDQFGNIVTNNTTSATATLASGTGALGGTRVVAFNGGVANFNAMTITKNGAFTISFADSGVTGATTNSFTLNPDVASQVAFTQQPGDTTAGQPLPTVAVSVEDQYGNVVTTDTSTITLGISGGGGGNLRLILAATNGVATFNGAAINVAGSYELRATDGSLTSGLSNDFTISPDVASQLVFSQGPADATVGPLLPVKVSVEDQFGNVETSDSSTITLSLASGPGTLSGTKVIAVQNGVATFGDLSLNALGTYTMNAANGNLPNATSSSFHITPSIPTTLVFTQQATDTTAGLTIPTLKVSVEDQYGNVVTTDTSTVTIALGSGTGTLQGTKVATAVNGIATFSGLSMNTAGTVTIAATDNLLASATSSSFAITPDVATKLVITQGPSDTTAGQNIPTMTIAVEDQFGNVETGDNSNVVLAITTGAGTLTGTTTRAASAGIATFSNLSMTTAGSVTLSVTDGQLTSATSSGFHILPAIASKLAITQQTASTIAGHTLSTLKVSVEDQYGNVETNDSSTITLGVGEDSGPLLGTKVVTAASGVATFSTLSIDAAGSVTISATDGELTGANATPITISPDTATKLVITAGPTDMTAGQTISTITIAVEDQFGNVETGNNSNVILAITSGAGTLTGTTNQQASAGIATFDDLSITTAGSVTLSATDTGLTSATSSSFTISPDIADHLAITSGPESPIAAGSTLANIVVQVQDQFGNVITGDTSNITISLDDESAVVTGNNTANAVAGIATLSGLAIDTAGTYTISATDDSLTPATVSSFVVNPAAASQLVFTEEPGNGAPGNLGEVAVNIEDAFGNIVTSSNANVTISSAGSGTLAGTKTVAAVAGVATFENLAISKNGNYILTAASNGVTNGTSDPFSLGARLVFQHQPGTTVAGQTIGGSALVVFVEDSSGHVITADNSAVTIDIFSGPNGATLEGTVTVNAINGSASFTDLDITTAGSYKLAASDGSLPNTTSNAFTISPDAPASLSILQNTANVVAGAKSSALKVQVLDQFGNVTTNSRSPVVLTIGNGPLGGAITGTVSVVPSNGVATFSTLSFKKAGQYTLHAADTGTDGLNFTQFTVAPAAAKKLIFNQQPTNALASANISPAITVDIVDSFGNLVSSTANVTLSLASGPSGATLSRTVAASAGEATFSTINFTRIGTTYKLKAAASGLGNVTSTQFAITQPVGLIPAAFLAL